MSEGRALDVCGKLHPHRKHQEPQEHQSCIENSHSIFNAESV